MNKIDLLKQHRHWTEEVILTQEIWEENDKPSVRKLAELIGKSKSWIDKSLRLAIGLRVYPYLAEERTRHSAYRFLLKRRKKS